MPAGATPDAPPQWAKVASDPSWGWFDHRLHPEPRTAPSGADAERSVRLARFRVPFEYGGQPVIARGRVLYEPPRGSVSARLRGRAAPFRDVTVQLAPGKVPGLVLANRGDEPVVVLGAHGEPFLRVGPGGSEVNRHSPTWIDNARARDQDLSTATAVADPKATPDWSLLSTAATISWLEFRGNYERADPPPRVVASGKTAVLRRWSVPIERDGRRATVRGETIWKPLDD